LVYFDDISDIISKGDETSVINVHTEHKIKRKGKGGSISIVTETEDKVYSISFFKRRRLDDSTSVPFWYKCGREGEGRVITPDHP